MGWTQLLSYNYLGITTCLPQLNDVVYKVARHILCIALARDIKYSNTFILIHLFFNLPITLYRSRLLCLAVLVALMSTGNAVVLWKINDIFLQLIGVIGVIDIVGYLLRLKHAGLW